MLDSWAGQPISAPLEQPAGAGPRRRPPHELTENMRSDPGIFDFVKWLQVGEPDASALEEAKARELRDDPGHQPRAAGGRERKDRDLKVGLKKNPWWHRQEALRLSYFAKTRLLRSRRLAWAGRSTGRGHGHGD